MSLRKFSIAAGLFFLLVFFVVALWLWTLPSFASLLRDFGEVKPDLEKLAVMIEETSGASYDVFALYKANDDYHVNGAGGMALPVEEVKANRELVDKINEMKQLLEKIGATGIYYVRQEKSVWVTMLGGGVLGSDLGYVKVTGDIKVLGELHKYQLVSGERNWFVFAN